MFELRWHDNPNTRIEDVLGGVEEIVRAEGDFSKKSLLLHEIMCELIHVEMELRANRSQHFRKAEYESRFPDHDDAVESAWLRLQELYPENILFTTAVVRTKAQSSQELDEAHVAAPTVFGPFQHLEQIGEGGFGVVCKGFDVRSSEWVALKFPRKDVISNAELLRAFEAEAERVIGLQHPGIVETKSIEYHDGYVAIVQQLINGTNLKDAAESLRDPKMIATLMARVADAIAYANSNGVIHRDLKPANILLDEDGLPYISDFGLSLHETDQALYPDEQCGTPPYMSPQLVEGLTRNLDGRTDIWSLGVILYELLAGQRPFLGISRSDIFDQIETRDPRPIREIDSTVHRELQRICLRCLEKSARDRYMTADELADDLRHWLNSGDQDDCHSEPLIVPKGLRSYGPADAGFFTTLLPGPRDRDGIPSSVQFWINFLKSELAENNPSSVGILCGPSGSGKSSFVKAAVLPRVVEEFQVVFVECTRADTEVRLLKSLRKVLKDVPANLSLADLFRGVSAGRWNPGGKKILVVLDQFEQRLSINDLFEKSQLVKAIRHCDKSSLSCMLIVRDGFWSALTRFLDALEMDLRENQNCQAIDLFDKSHARKVMRRLGHAYGKLPPPSKPLSPDQSRFVESTVSQLAVNHRVVCVQLVIFAEMFKYRDWVPAQLKSMGGVKGVGEAFLDFHFGEEEQNSRIEPYREQAKLALESLLPEEESRIRGALKSEAELKKSVGLEDDDAAFVALIQILEDDLRLISRTDPDRGNEEIDVVYSGESSGSASWFQLTHDYLVPSIRAWLEQINQQSPKARAKSRFSNLARSWSASGDDRFLPTPMEFASTLRFARYRELVPHEQELYKKSMSFYLRRAGMFVAIAAFLACALFVFNRNRDRELANAWVANYLAGQPEDVAANIERMRGLSSDSKSNLEAINSSDYLDDNIRIRIRLALTSLDPNPTSEAISRLIDCVFLASDREGRNFLDVFRLHKTRSLPMLVSKFEELVSRIANEPSLRHKLMPDVVRLAVVIAALDDPQKIETYLADENHLLFRLRFVHVFGQWGDEQVLTHSGFLNLDEDKAIAAICLAYGQCARKLNHPLPVEMAEHLRRLSNSHRSEFAKAAARWACGDSVKIRDVESSLVGVKGGRMAFEILNREVMSKEFRQFLDDPDWPAKEKPLRPLKLSDEGGDLPACGISVIDAILFCNWLSVKAGLDPSYVRAPGKFPLPPGTLEQQEEIEKILVCNRRDNWTLVANAEGYRLPTHDEWSLAADQSKMITLPLDRLAEFGSNFARVDEETMQKPCSLMPNEHGLFDIYGNVAECCWTEGQQHRLAEKSESRGGSFLSELPQLIPRRTNSETPYIRNSHLARGFRVVKSISDRE